MFEQRNQLDFCTIQPNNIMGPIEGNGTQIVGTYIMQEDLVVIVNELNGSS